MEYPTQGSGIWRLPIVLGVLALPWLLIAAAAVVRFQGWTVDDFYITYRYAENLAQGSGFVYNPGERVFGVSILGWGSSWGCFTW
ncbi:MAG TPA: hypothetical protein VKM72_27745 [Thermoanaerobaculia bacterium]|nr:hypothetical protein [Thermoanaerobaculia bacterium]